MTARRGCRLALSIGAAGLMLALGIAATARAQGFGPDPFRPYGAQYDPYTYPMGPAAPGAGGSGPVMPRSGLFGANQYQQYLDSLSGAAADRAPAGVGAPYYRSAIDPAFEHRLGRGYRPNAEVDSSFEKTQQLAANKYFSYLMERDPARRAALLREYQSARREASRTVGSRRELPGRAASAGARNRPETGTPGEGGAEGAAATPLPPALPAPRGSSAATRPGTSSLRGGSTEPTRPRAAVPPPPPIGSYRLGDRRRRTPLDVLNRARGTDLGNDGTGRYDRSTSSRSRAAASSGTDRPPPSAVPSPRPE
jgi:hypothetical protein